MTEPSHQSDELPLAPSVDRSSACGHDHDHDHDSGGCELHSHRHCSFEPAHSHEPCGHSHGMRPETADQKRRLFLTLLLVSGYMVAEIVGGWWSNSLSLLADAGHMFSDAASLGLSAFAVWLADRPAGRQRTFGFYRAEILAALINGAALVGVALLIFVEAFERLGTPARVHGPLMMSVATGGLIVNLVSLKLLGGHHGNLNMRGAWLHVLSDTLGSVAAILAGALVYGFGWNLADTVTSAVIGVLVIASSWRLLGESVQVLMEGAPVHVDVAAIERELKQLEGVLDVHDIHVWTITSGRHIATLHVVARVGLEGHALQDVLSRVRSTFQQRTGISHLTVQIEPPDFVEPPPCR